jgi:hypothetical protein
MDFEKITVRIPDDEVVVASVTFTLIVPPDTRLFDPHEDAAGRRPPVHHAIRDEIVRGLLDVGCVVEDLHVAVHRFPPTAPSTRT